MDELELILDNGEKGSEIPSRRVNKPTNTTPQSRVRWSWLIVLGIFAIAIILGIQMARQNRTQPMPGEAAPLFTLTTFDGETISLEALRGKIVIVNFWANGCVPCHQEAPDLVAIDEDYRDKNVVIVGINWLESNETALSFIDQYDITYANGADLGEKIAQTYQIEGIPETYVIDRNGIVVETLIGPTTYDHLSEALDSPIASAGAS